MVEDGCLLNFFCKPCTGQSFDPFQMCPVDGALSLGFLVSVTPKRSWTLNKVMLKLQHSEFEGSCFLAMSVPIPLSIISLLCFGVTNNYSAVRQFCCGVDFSEQKL